MRIIDSAIGFLKDSLLLMGIGLAICGFLHLLCFLFWVEFSGYIYLIISAIMLFVNILTRVVLFAIGEEGGIL